jgi:hypothetical protein
MRMGVPVCMRVPVLVRVRMGVHNVSVPVRMRMHMHVHVRVFMVMFVGVLPLRPVVVVRVIVRQAFAIRHGDPPMGDRSSIGCPQGLRNPLA